MIVIDVGCATWGGDKSIPHLIDEFRPEQLWGYDPAVRDYLTYRYRGCEVVERPVAAWTYDGAIGFEGHGLGGHVAPDAPDEDGLVPCVNICRVINELAGKGEEVILKLDAEGAEYFILPHLRTTDADLALKLCLVEWHCADCGIGGNGRHLDGCEGDHDAWDERRRDVEGLLRCPTGTWNR